MDADEREAVDGEEQHGDDDEDDAGTAVSVEQSEQSGPPVGLYLKDNMMSVLSTFISCPEKNEEFCAKAFHTISGLSRLKTGVQMQKRRDKRGLCAVPRSGGKEPLNVPRPLLRSDFTTSRVDKKSAGYALPARPDLDNFCWPDSTRLTRSYQKMRISCTDLSG